MYSGEYYINFRVSASIDSDPGIYYMNSSVEETKLKGAESNLYDPLCKTIIEVAPKEKAVFTVADIPNIRVGNTSRPIAITTKNSPHSGITINVEMDETLVASDISI